MQEDVLELEWQFAANAWDRFYDRQEADGRARTGRLASAMVLWFAAAVVAGCGGPTDPHAAQRTAEIDLALTHGGEPFLAGLVTLAADEPGNDVGGKPGPTGVLKVAAVPGRYTVVVNLQSAPMVPGEPPPPPPVGQEKIPKVVRSRTSSPWKIDVKQGKNRFDFDLDIK